MLFTQASNRGRSPEPEPDAPHFHVWVDTGGLALIALAPRFKTGQAARQAAISRKPEDNSARIATALPSRHSNGAKGAI